MTYSTKQRIQLIKDRLEAMEHQPAGAFVVQAEDARALVDAFEWEVSIKKELISLQEQWVKERMIYIEALAEILSLHKPDGNKCKELAQKALQTAEDALSAFYEKKSSGQ